LYIKRIYLENIRCFKKLNLDLHSNQDLSYWALILGDNGVGKTSVLRCIAMGMCDATSASALLKEISGSMIRDDADQAKIYVELIDIATSKTYLIKTRLSRSAHGDVDVDQDVSGSFPWQKVFVCGYGASRSVYGTEDYDKYSTINSVYSLFNYESSLQNPELVLRRLQDTLEVKAVLSKIDKILMLPEGSTMLTRSGLVIDGPWGNFKSSGTISDGYSATLALVADMIGWWGMIQQEQFIHTDLEGIVLIDELEQHLHPKWQQSIIKLLHDQFPKIQFLTTTHSPLCAIGTSDLKDEECELILLRRVQDHVEGLDDQKPPRRLRADQVLTSYLFGLDSTRSHDAARDINRYSYLKAKKQLTQDEQKELVELHSSLDRYLGSEETELQRLVERAVKKAFEKLPQQLSSIKFDSSAVDFEIKRQLKGLFDFSETHDQD